MLPATLALIEDHPESAAFMAAYLREQGIAVTAFADSEDFLVSQGAYDFDFYLVDLELPGIDGLDLIRLLRRRVRSGIVAVSGRQAPDIFEQVVNAGADLFLAKPSSASNIGAAVRAVYRRCSALPAATPWRLDSRKRQLTTPLDVAVELGDNDVAVLEVLLAAAGQAVPRDEICQRLGRDPSAATDNWLHATIYRLRRRVEQASGELLPLQSQSRVGYVFRGSLISG